MSAPGVLAVMDRAAEVARDDAEHFRSEQCAELATNLTEARAAVAELYRERDELIARRQEDAAILDAIRNVVGGPYDTIATRVAELVEAAKLCALAATPADDSHNDGLFVVRAKYVHALRAALAACGGA